MISRLSMKSKILLFLIPALVYMTGVSVVLIYQNYEIRTKATQVELSGRYFLALSQLVHVLQKERGISAGVLTGKVARNELDSHRTLVDSKVEEVRTLLPQLPDTTRENTSAKLRDLVDIRKYVDSNGAAPESTKKFSILNVELISLQSNRSREYSLNGLENKLISQSIFEMAKENAGRLRAFVVGVIGQDKPISTPDLIKINTYRLGITINLESQGLVISEQARQDVNGVLTSSDWTQVINTLDKIEARSTAGIYELDAKAYFDTITRVIDSIAKVINSESSALQTVIESTRSSATLAFWLYFLVATTGVCLITLLALRIIKEVTSTLTSVAGDLSQSVSIVAESSRQLSDASSSLSSGVTEQAAALQETVSSLEEVRSMVGKNAEGSKHAQELAGRSNEEVGKGKDAVDKMLSAVNEIHRSNEAIERQVDASNQELTTITQVITEIGNKTRIINDIVFQTKLLSFNASVEAARAGEHGKGFAVVAEEVGNLAAMSGNAAKEIVQLLESSTKKVDSIVRETKARVGTLITDSKTKIGVGVSTAKQCEAILDSIEKSTDELAQVVSEVATASEEQAKGVDEIAKAMNQLEEVTHNNSTAANQGAVVATQLSQQTGSIEGFVRKLEVLVRGDTVSGNLGSSMDKPGEGGRASPSPHKNTMARGIPLERKEAKSEHASSFNKAIGAETPPSQNDPRFEEV